MLGAGRVRRRIKYAMDNIMERLRKLMQNLNRVHELGTQFTSKVYKEMLAEEGITAHDVGFEFNRLVTSLLEIATQVAGEKVSASDEVIAVMEVMAEWEIRQINQKRMEARHRKEARLRARDAARAALFGSNW